jgi:hypothetical protein
MNMQITIFLPRTVKKEQAINLCVERKRSSDRRRKIYLNLTFKYIQCLFQTNKSQQRQPIYKENSRSNQHKIQAQCVLKLCAIQISAKMFDQKTRIWSAKKWEFQDLSILAPRFQHHQERVRSGYVLQWPFKSTLVS